MPCLWNLISTPMLHWRVPRLGISLENREGKARQLGQPGKTVCEMLVIEVERPDTFPDLDSLETLDTQQGSLVHRQWHHSNSLSALAGVLSKFGPNEGHYYSFRLRRAEDEMDPNAIYYIHDSIGKRFRCGRDVCDTMNKLKRGCLRASDIPTIRVFMWNGRWHSEDNRRLWCFKEAGLTAVPVRRIDWRQVPQDKFTTRNKGESVTMRG